MVKKMSKLLNIKKQHPLKITLAALSFFISYIIKMITIAPTVSFWDCGEYIATSYTLGIPHPPGSPLFLLIERVLTMLPIGSNIAFRANLISPLVASFTVLFLFLITVKFLEKYVDMDNKWNRISVYMGAFIGAMTFAFTDSHWFNSVETERYAFSTFLTSLVMWLAMRWEEKENTAGHERYLLFIAYLLGLATGVHLLSLLVIFVLALIIYFKYYEISSTPWLIADLLIGAAGSGILFVVIKAFFSNPDQNMLLIGLITLGIFMGIYYLINKYSDKHRFKEHSNNVFMGFFTSVGFLVINNGIIRGVPKIADSFGMISLPILFILLIGITGWAIKSKKQVFAIAFMSIILILIGYSTYSTIYIRSNQDPAIDENNPDTPDRFISYVQREQYGQRSFTDIFDRKNDRQLTSREARQKYKNKSDWYFLWNYQIKKMYLRYFNWQFVGRAGREQNSGVDPFQFILPFPLLIGLYGAVQHFTRDNRHALTVLALFLFTGLMIILYLNQKAPQPRERDYSYTGSFFAFSIWIGIGVSEIIRKIKALNLKKWKKPALYGSIILLTAILPANLLIANWDTHDRSGNYVPHDYAYNILNTCDEDAIVFTNGDNDTFPLWYIQQVEEVRTDVKVVNLSLLNTPWYIKQLKTRKPKIDLGLSNERIDKLSPMRWKKDRTVSVPTPDSMKKSKINWKMPPTIGGGRGIRIQDLMIWKIIQANDWKRPIYFSITVAGNNMIGLRKAGYLQMEGLAYKLHPKKVDRVNQAKMEENLTEVYKYRNLTNPDVFFDPDARKVVGNYRSVFYQLGVNYYRNGKYKKAAETFNQMGTKIPPEVFPFRSNRLKQQLKRIFQNTLQRLSRQTGQSLDTLKQKYKNLNFESSQASNMSSSQLPGQQSSSQKSSSQNKLDQKIQAIQMMFHESDDIARLEPTIKKMWQQNKNNAKVRSLLVQTYEKQGKHDQAIQTLKDWLNRHPDDKEAQRKLDQLKKSKSN